jgi:hypothetical protein
MLEEEIHMLEEEIHMLESGSQSFIPPSGQPT